MEQVFFPQKIYVNTRITRNNWYGCSSLKIEGRLKTEYYIASIVSIYRVAIDDYMKNPENYDAEKYMKEIEKIKTRGLTTFYFNSRENKDIQEYEGKQYNGKLQNLVEK